MSSLKRPLVVALVLHAGILAAVRVVPVLRHAPQPPHVIEVATETPSVDIDVQDEPLVAPTLPENAAPSRDAVPGAVASREGDGERVAAAGEGTVKSRASMHEHVASAAAPEPGSAKTPAPSGQVPRDDSPGITFGPPDIGLNGTNPFLARGALPEQVPQAGSAKPEHRLTLAEQTALAKRRVQLSLHQAAEAHDRDIGLGPEGPVLAALGDAASATTAPIDGRAVFFARADHTGLVTSVDVLECNGARDGWMQAATYALRVLASKKLRMPSYAQCAEMKIEVTSGWKMPNGHDPGTKVSAFGAPLSKRNDRGTTVDIMDPKIQKVHVNRDLVIPVPSSQITAVATNGDASNIGAKPRRIVHTRLLGVSML
ncbi:hypothetical protein AKJ09_09664 [Labilithrix luteola]|uniref:Uncharacterized protein n=1 Tax=Labilithrix luteola TaxID=1391654 RepID=A0A0K1QB36_9BACT|nr:hypothetical protein [Labilithrix luteola]AKV03001.1 hypothetical protein AKJ09_09664 [Labilithrix luteola]